MSRSFRTLSTSEIALIVSALRCAAGHWDDVFAPGLTEQFERQARQAREIADELDTYPEVEITHA